VDDSAVTGMHPEWRLIPRGVPEQAARQALGPWPAGGSNEGRRGAAAAARGPPVLALVFPAAAPAAAGGDAAGLESLVRRGRRA